MFTGYRSLTARSSVYVSHTTITSGLHDVGIAAISAINCQGCTWSRKQLRMCGCIPVCVCSPAHAYEACLHRTEHTRPWQSRTCETTRTAARRMACDSGVRPGGGFCAARSPSPSSSASCLAAAAAIATGDARSGWYSTTLKGPFQLLHWAYSCDQQQHRRSVYQASTTGNAEPNKGMSLASHGP
jgi:hypothetical protein